MKIEICVGSLAEAIGAAEAGADRIEWCSALELGGLTPDPGLTNVLLNNTPSGCEVHAMIRPRPGNFFYSAQEFEAMKYNLEHFAKMGVHGVVYGFLDKSSVLDIDRTSTFTEHANRLGLFTTFHRAIDVCRHPKDAIDQFVELGVNRILTSGGAPTAEEGLNRITGFIEKVRGRIEVMPGGAINASNVHLFKEAGCTSVHFSCRERSEEEDHGFGSKYVFDREKFNAIQLKIR